MVAYSVPMQLIVFGDSLSDSGNIFSLTGGVAPPSPPYAGVFLQRTRVERAAGQPIRIDPAQRIPPRWRSGWARAPRELFRSRGSFTTSYPLASPPFPALSVSNFLDIDALSNGLPPAGLPGLSEQLALFHSMTPPGSFSSLGAPADATYVVWAGANDLIFSDLLDLSGFPAASTPAETLAPVAAANVHSAIVDLAAIGAERFVVANLPDIGLTPFAVASGRTVELSTATDIYNQVLGDLLAGLSLDVSVLDIHGQFDDLLSNPLAFGFSEIVSLYRPGYSLAALHKSRRHRVLATLSIRPVQPTQCLPMGLPAPKRPSPPASLCSVWPYCYSSFANVFCLSLLKIRSGVSWHTFSQSHSCH